MTENAQKKVKRRMQTDVMMTLSIIFLVFFGTVMIASASITSRSNATQVVLSTSIRQLIYVFVGLFTYFWMIRMFSL